MAQTSGMTQSAVHRIWRAFGLRPHLISSFKLFTDPLLIEKVRDIVGLYLAPPDRALVLCVDEKPQIQALERGSTTFQTQAFHNGRLHFVLLYQQGRFKGQRLRAA